MAHHLFNVSQQAVIFNERDELLILKTREHWLLPGGRVDEGEVDMDDALRREIKEETNLDLQEIVRPIGIDTAPNMTTYAIAFVCTVEDLNALRLSDEHVEYKWISKTESEDYLLYKRIAARIAQL